MNSEVGHANLELVTISSYFIFVAKNESSTDTRVSVIFESFSDRIPLIDFRQAPSQVESQRQQEENAES